MHDADPTVYSSGALSSDVRLALVLPTFNEDGCIRQTILDVVSKLPYLAPNFVVIAVDDGSSDATASILSGLARQLGHRVHVVHHERNRGYGDALRSGLAATVANRADFVHVMYADGQFDIGDLRSFLPLLDTCDAIFGYRIARHNHWQRKVNAAAWTCLVCTLFGIHLRDVDWAFRLMPASFLRGCYLHASGDVITTDLLVHTADNGLRFTQAGVHHYPRTTGAPSGAWLSVILRAFKELALLRLGRLDSGLSTPPSIMSNIQPVDEATSSTSTFSLAPAAPAASAPQPEPAPTPVE